MNQDMTEEPAEGILPTREMVMAGPETTLQKEAGNAFFDWINKTHTYIAESVMKMSDKVPEWIPIVGPMTKSMRNEAEMGLILKGIDPKTKEKFSSTKERVKAYAGAMGGKLFHQAEAAFDVLSFVAPEAQLPKVINLLRKAAETKQAADVVREVPGALKQIGGMVSEKKGGGIATKMGEILGTVLGSKMGFEMLVGAVEKSDGWKAFLEWMPGQSDDELRARMRKLRPMDMPPKNMVPPGSGQVRQESPVDVRPVSDVV